jgi:hypothetical protein
MPRGSRRSTAPPPQPPANAAEGASLVRGLVMKLFDHQDGDGANWRLLAESLFRVAFDALDRLPDDQKQALARRVHAGAYDRWAGNAPSGFSASEPSAPGHDRPEPSGLLYGPENRK